MAERAREVVAETRGGAGLADCTVGSEHLLQFPEGVIGFPDARRFALLESSRPGSPFRSLACLDAPDVRFVVCDPAAFGIAYGTELPLPADASPVDVAVLAIVTVRPGGAEITVNLMAPLVIDCRTRTGRQVVVDTGRYSTRHALVAAPAGA
jgi:flagellar assembly factor FliW